MSMKICKILILLVIAAKAFAEPWPTAAIPDPQAGLSGTKAGQLEICAQGSMLKVQPWSEKRTMLSLGLGLGHGFGLNLSSNAREISGYGSFQRGLGDSKLGISFWPEISDKMELGINGDFIIPTGFRTQEAYRDANSDSIQLMPALGMGQTGGEMYAGFGVKLGSASLHTSIGYLTTSDRADQAFRWSFGTRISPFGPRYTAELDYAQSMTRKGTLPDAEVLSAAVAVGLPWGFTLAPGLWADLGSNPIYGGSLGLRFTAPLGYAQSLPKNRLADNAVEVIEPHKGLILVPPPRADFSLADENELWNILQQEAGNAFASVRTLPSLDVPGLPYDDRTPDAREKSLRALALANPDAQWLLITRMEKEDVSRQKASGMSSLLPQSAWKAECRLHVDVVNLTDNSVLISKTIISKSTRRDHPLKTISGSSDDVLSLADSRALTIEAYHEAGTMFARMSTNDEPELPTARTHRVNSGDHDDRDARAARGLQVGTRK
jgi:hypothetical protein